MRMLSGAGGAQLELDGSNGTYQIQQTAIGGTVEDIWVSMARNGGVQLRFNNVAQVATTALGTQMDLPIYMFERAAANTNSPTFGQWWVRNDATQTPMFTADDGTTFELNASGGAGISGTPANNQIAVWTGATDIEGDANLTWDGSQLTVDGVLEMEQRAAALTPVATNYGQWWVRSINPNIPVFTNDDDEDFDGFGSRYLRKSSGTQTVSTAS